MSETNVRRLLSFSIISVILFFTLPTHTNSVSIVDSHLMRQRKNNEEHHTCQKLYYKYPYKLWVKICGKHSTVQKRDNRGNNFFSSTAGNPPRNIQKIFQNLIQKRSRQS